MTLLVRPARPDELDDVGRLTVAAYVSDGLLPADHWYAEELRDARGRAEHATLLVAEHDGTVIGTATVAGPGTPWAEIAEAHEAELRMLAVDPAGRGRGAGEALVRAALDVARAAGAEVMALTSLDTMRTAHRLYERLGFRREPRRDRAVEGYRMLVFALDLARTPAPDETPEPDDASGAQ